MLHAHIQSIHDLKYQQLAGVVVMVGAFSLRARIF